MAENERLEKICKEFCLLSEAKQEYILGMLQALVYVNNELAQVLEPAYNPHKEAYNEQ